LIGTHQKFEIDFRNSVRKMCRRADAVVCSTLEQKNDISEHCSNVHVILDAHSGTVRTVKTDYRRSGAFKIAWEGLGGNFPFVKVIGGALKALSATDDIELHVVTDPEIHRYFGQLGHAETAKVAKEIFPNTIVYPWQEETCASIVTNCDLAVIPINTDNKFAMGKPENKLVLLWRMAMPVITTGTPAYIRAMHAAGLDNICNNEEEWISAIRTMMTSERQRSDSAKKGHNHVLAAYSESSIYAQWDAVFASCGF
jgi:hypothetical protein